MNLSAYNSEQRGVGSSKRAHILRLIRAKQSISRSEIAERLKIDKSTVSENVSSFIAAGILREENSDTKLHGRRARLLTLVEDGSCFIGVNLGVRRIEVGIGHIQGSVSEEIDIATPASPGEAISEINQAIRVLLGRSETRSIKRIGISVPGMTDSSRQGLVYAPNLNWRDVSLAKELSEFGVETVIENDATAAALYEARMRIDRTVEAMPSDFVIVRSGTGIGVGIIIGGEVFRGTGTTRGVAGEFGHMTIIAGGKACECGNRGCWEK